MTLKATLKRHAPAPVLRAAAWRRDVWGDLRLRLLTSVGRIPSHRAHKIIYRRYGMRLPTSSAIHWRAEFYAPERIVIGENVTIGDTCFLDGRSGPTIGDGVNLGSRVHIYTREHDVHSLNRPGVSGGSVPWEGWSHVREYIEEVSGRAA